MTTPAELYKAGKYQEGIASILALPEPRDPAYTNLMGVCYMRLANVDAALQIFDSLLLANPDFTEAAANRKGALMLQCSLLSDEANKQVR